MDNNNLTAVENYFSAIDKELIKLDNPEFSRFFDSEQNKLLTFKDYFDKLEEEKQNLFFNISTLINDFQAVQKWTMQKCFDFIKFKNKQIKKGS